MRKHKSHVFDCWDSLKTALRSSHPKHKRSENSILKPLLPGLGWGKGTLVLHDMGKKRKGGKEGKQERKKSEFLFPRSPKSLALAAGEVGVGLS